MIRMVIVLMAGVCFALAQQDHDAAVHQHGFLRFQIADHKAGDCTAVR